ncbi:MAG: thioredoxin family protein [Psychrobium sp.]
MKKILLICSLFLSTSAFAGGVMQFTEDGFKQLQKENAAILVDVYATWCPTCRKQGKVIKEYFKQNPDSELTVLKVDYDKQKEWVKYFKAFRQSTLIRYQGDKEIGRSIAETNERKLFNLFSMKAPSTKSK